jgi:glutamate synthase domain-containing protein 3
MASRKNSVVKMDAGGVYYQELNANLRKAMTDSVRRIELRNVHGQRYIGTDLNQPVEIEIFGTPGNDLGAFMNGPRIIVFVREDVGYRAGIHMKEYRGRKPALVIGGTAQDFVGEYMAGGVLILLGLNLKEGENHKANFIGTGMHGGVIYLRGSVEEYQLGKEVGVAQLEEADRQVLKQLVGEFAAHFGYDADEILNHKFIKLFPRWLRPYGRLYAY